MARSRGCTLLRCALVLAVVCQAAEAQWVSTLYAGNTQQGHVDGSLLSATFSFNLGSNIAFLQNGTLFIADSTRIRVIDPGGTSTRTIIDATADPNTDYRGICINTATNRVYAVNYGLRRLERIWLNGAKTVVATLWNFYPLACTVDPTTGDIIAANTYSYNLERVNATTGTRTSLLNGNDRKTINAVGTASYTHEPFCVWVEPTSGDIIWCDAGGSDGTGSGSIRRYRVATSTASTIFNVNSPVALAPDATGANWFVFSSNGQSFGVYNVASNTYSGSWISPWIGYGTALTVHPTTGQLYASAGSGGYGIYTIDPPPPSPPPEPPSPPSPPPGAPQAPLPVQPFFNIMSCPGAAHQLSAAAGPIADLVSGGGWTGTPVEAGPNAPLSTYNKPMAVGQDPSLQLSNTDPYMNAQRAWVFRGQNGVRLAPGGGTSVGGSDGFTLAVWFRIDDIDARTYYENIVLELVFNHPGGGTVTLILTTRYAYGSMFMAPLRAVWCCTPGGTTTTSDVDYAISSSTDQFQTAPNGLQVAVGTWQHVVATFDGSGAPLKYFWNGIEQEQPSMVPGDYGASPGSERTLAAAAVLLVHCRDALLRAAAVSQTIGPRWS